MKEIKTLAASANGKELKISQVVVVQPPRRDTTDVEKWRNAITAADRGKRLRLVHLLNDLRLDPVLEDALTKRIEKITNSQIVFLSNGDEVEDMADFIDSLVFEELLTEIMLTKAYGKSVIEMGAAPTFNIFSVPRENLDTSKKVILKDFFSEDGISYEDDDFLLNLGKDNDLGFLTRVAPYAIFKRNGGADYAQFCELFGIDALAFMYDPEDENGKREMEAAAEKRGSGASMVMSTNGDVKTIGSTQTGAVHLDFLGWLDEQILIGVLGQTMTTKDGSSLSQSQIHKDTEDEITRSDRRWVQRILNTYVTPFLEKRGYPVKNGFFMFVMADDTPMLDKLNIALAVDNATEEGVDDDYFYETFGLPRGERAKKASGINTKKEEEEETEEEEDSKKSVKAKELSFFERMRDFFYRAPR